MSYATTYEASCSGGEDLISLLGQDDIAFGGALGDERSGGDGQDVLFGDFGIFDMAGEEFLPGQRYQTIITEAEWAGGDIIYGGAGDDIIFGQEGSDYIEGGTGSDDIVGGHSMRTGEDAGDVINGDSGHDAVLADNGEIIRDIVMYETFPWMTAIEWQNYESPFNDHVVRQVRRYDDIDFVQGDDMIFGGGGNDELHGQRGDDYIEGGSGEDELYGELGSDELHGGEGNDIACGDICYAIRRYDTDGNPVVQSEITDTTSTNVWHKDVILEELGEITQIQRISDRTDPDSMSVEDVVYQSLLFVANAYDADGAKVKEDPKELCEIECADSNCQHECFSNWITDMFVFDLETPYNDFIYGDGGADVLIGQRGDGEYF